MGTRAQIDVCERNKVVVRIYSQFDGYPSNILLALRGAMNAGPKPLHIARAIIRQFPDDFGIEIIDEDLSEHVSYHYVVDVDSKPWRVRQTRMAGYELPTLPNGEIDDSNEAFAAAKRMPAVTRSFRIGK